MTAVDEPQTAAEDGTAPIAVDDFIGRWGKSGGAESANFQTFANELCDLLGVPKPDPAQERVESNDYVFERRVDYKFDDGTTARRRIDLYKRDRFVMEAKQSAKRVAVKKADPCQPDLIPEDATQVKAGTATRGTGRWDRVMRAAKKQAEDYARALPKEHGWPPFILVVDVGHVIEVYADFSGQGKNYAQFPDRDGYSVPLEGLRDQTIRDRLRAIWCAPHSLDPARRSAEVTRDIAERLARIARSLEGKHDPKEVAEFLMRCLFTMFAEDVGLLPEKGLEKLLGEMVETPEHFAPAVESLWAVMDEGGYAPHLNATIKRFNGTLFRKRKAIALEKDDIRELQIAAGRDWRDVEPAIFGTLLERALDKQERAKLGAHYTPRAYVERLVVPTIIEPLRADWEEALTRAHELEEEGKREAARETITVFHHRLCTTRVLDPACGTGNFLYVSLELMKRLEGEVLDALEDLGENPRLAMKGETVSPHQFHGLELNPRAVAIADLVLWIGYLKWQLRTVKADQIAEPILHAYGTIREQDAILAWDKQELLRDENGLPLSRWDGVSMRLHPITGEEVPDPDATMELYRYVNPRRAEWPEAEFIVGNPPFIGGKDMRAELGDGYAEAAWKARPKIPGGADFVMHFWDEAAARLLRKPTKGGANPLRRFGFITTNSVTQTFSRRVIERHARAKEPLSLIFAVPNHPWQKAANKAAVRIAMTVAARGEENGTLATVERESALNTDTPIVELRERAGKINGNLKIGADITAVHPLMANELISSPGVKLHGSGFIVTPQQAAALGLGSTPGLEKHILPYRHGRDIAQRPRGVMVIDLYPLSADEVRDRFPRVYQHVAERVKPEREAKVGRSADMAEYARKWWLFGKVRSELRPVLEPLHRYIATAETSKHRFFQFLDANIRPDNMLVCIGSSAGSLLAVLSSRANVAWSIEAGGWLGMGNDPRYSKSRTFDPMPFPFTEGSDSTQSALGNLGDRLDSFRKERLAEHDFLTMTALYNVLERVRELEKGCDVPPLSAKERDIHEAGLISVLKDIHDDIDRAVFEAYGWADLIPALVGKPGATAPSPHKTAEQEEAEEDLLARLVDLNRERAADERRGIVRWLRPDYQIPKLGHKVRKPEEAVQAEADLPVPEPADGKPAWPRDGLDQIGVVRDMLGRAPAPLAPEALSAAFRGTSSARRKKRVEQVLQTLVAAGVAQQGIDGQEGGSRFFIPR